ncbi:MAG TPA: PfkB family carbohydrate kinase [Phycisphaerae bacterium]|nr:PfkB family carbohydrate kinase [Phycisphaerae bacterium]
MSLLVTGTIGIDTVETPFGKAAEVLGGSAVYFSFAASLLSPVRLVGVVGEDFPRSFREMFQQRDIDTAGLELRAGSKTFRWHGKYIGDMNAAETLRTDLNVVSERPPLIPEAFRDSKFVFLANTHPALQRGFIDQLKGPRLVVCDTMNLWISQFREELIETLGRVDGVIFNDGEARLLTGEDNLILAGQRVLNWGPKFVIIKKGEHGAVLVSDPQRLDKGSAGSGSGHPSADADDGLFVMPAYPTTRVVDPTGAGDSFAGGVMGHLASAGQTDLEAIKSAMVRGACLASITIESFSLDSIRTARKADLEKRLAQFRRISSHT